MDHHLTAVTKMSDNENQLKTCSVRIEKMPVEDADTDSSSFDDDIPFKPNISNCDLRPHACKSVDELLSDSINLVKTMHHARRQENLRTHVLDSDQPAASNDDFAMDTINLYLPREEESFFPERTFIKIYCEKSFLVFYNAGDVSPIKCGYNPQSPELTAFEKLLVSLQPVEFEYMLSFSLSFYPTNHVMDCKSFISYLLRMISVIEDKDSIDACNYAIQTLLTEHPSVHDVSFSTSELFMLLFNYGVDINKCYLLEVMPELREELTSKESSYCYSNKIPGHWWYNLKATLTVLFNLICFCSFSHDELFNILLFLLWLSMEESLINKDLYQLIFDCIDVILESFSEDIWPDTCLHLTDALLEIENPNWNSKWSCIYFMVSRIPFVTERGISIRKCICFKALKKFCSEHSSVLEEAKEFNISSLKLLLETAIFNVLPKFSSCDRLCLFINFFDICVNHMEFKSEVEKEEFCTFLKFCENCIKKNDTPAKSHLLRIFSRLKLGITVDSINVHNIKKECEDNISPDCSNEKSDAVPKCLSSVSEICTDFAVNEYSEIKVANFSDVIIPSTSGIILSSSKDFSNISPIIRETGNLDLPETKVANFPDAIIPSTSGIILSSSKDFSNISPIIRETGNSDLPETKVANFPDVIIPSTSGIMLSSSKDLSNVSPITETGSSDLSLSFPVNSIVNEDSKKQDADSGSKPILLTTILSLKNEFFADCSSDSLTPIHSSTVVDHADVSQLTKEENCSSTLSFPSDTTKTFFKNHETANLGMEYCYQQQYDLDRSNVNIEKHSEQSLNRNAEVLNLSVTEDTFVQNSLHENNANSDKENSGDIQNILQEHTCASDTNNGNEEFSSSYVCYQESIDQSIFPEKIIHSVREDELTPALIPSSNSFTETGTVLDKQFIDAEALDVVPIKTVINRFKSQSLNSKQQSNRNSFNESVYSISDSSSEESDVECISCNVQPKPNNVVDNPLQKEENTSHCTVISIKTAQKSIKRPNSIEDFSRKKKKKSSNVVNSKTEHPTALTNDKNLNSKATNSQKECVESTKEHDDDSDVVVLDSDNDDCFVVYLKNDVITID